MVVENIGERCKDSEVPFGKEEEGLNNARWMRHGK
jgi:hypothetical protein